MKRVLWLVVWLVASTALADITVKPQYEANEPIVATVTPTGVPAGALIRGSVQVTDASYEFAPAPNATALRQQALILREMASKLPAENETDRTKLTTAATEIERTLEGDTYYVWAKQGKHTITASGMWVLTDTGTLGGKLLDFGLYSFTKDFVVGEGDDPVPPPPPPPPPGGPYQVVLFYSPDQLDNLTADQREILNSMVYREKLKAVGHNLLGVLADNAAPSPQSKFRAFYNAVAGDPMPRVALASKDGGKVVDFPLPATVEALDALLATEVLK